MHLCHLRRPRQQCLHLQLRLRRPRYRPDHRRPRHRLDRRRRRQCRRPDHRRLRHRPDQRRRLRWDLRCLRPLPLLLLRRPLAHHRCPFRTTSRRLPCRLHRLGLRLRRRLRCHRPRLVTAVAFVLPTGSCLSDGCPSSRPEHFSGSKHFKFFKEACLCYCCAVRFCPFQLTHVQLLAVK